MRALSLAHREVVRELERERARRQTSGINAKWLIDGTGFVSPAQAPRLLLKSAPHSKLPFVSVGNMPDVDKLSPVKKSGVFLTRRNKLLDC